MPIFRTRVGYPLDELRDEFDRLWSTLTTAPTAAGLGTGTSSRPFPAITVAERDDAVVVEAELPGFDTADVEISVKHDELVLRGSRPDADALAGDGESAAPVTWHRRERDRGPFERRIPLPVAIDAARAEAQLVDGVLTVTCPKAAEAQPRKVEVRTS